MKNQIDLALEIASVAHQKQYRKQTQTPYIVHPVAVALLLTENQCTQDEIIAGILHDVLEDTELNEHDLQKHFGATVTSIVRECSEPHKECSWEERKQHTIDHILTMSLSAQRVLCTDKYHNLRTIADDLNMEGEQIWSRFKRGKAKQQWYYQNIIQQFEIAQTLDSFPVFTSLKNIYSIVFTTS